MNLYLLESPQTVQEEKAGPASKSYFLDNVTTNNDLSPIPGLVWDETRLHRDENNEKGQRAVVRATETPKFPNIRTTSLIEPFQAHIKIFKRNTNPQTEYIIPGNAEYIGDLYPKGLVERLFLACSALYEHIGHDCISETPDGSRQLRPDVTIFCLRDARKQNIHYELSEDPSYLQRIRTQK